MHYVITCVCGEDIATEAENDEQAVKNFIPLMDAHVAATEHPDVPADLTREQKVGMIQGQMRKGE